jgi:hypothetical protein
MEGRRGKEVEGRKEEKKEGREGEKRYRFRTEV